MRLVRFIASASMKPEFIPFRNSADSHVTVSLPRASVFLLAAPLKRSMRQLPIPRPSAKARPRACSSRFFFGRHVRSIFTALSSSRLSWPATRLPTDRIRSSSNPFAPPTPSQMPESVTDEISEDSALNPGSLKAATSAASSLRWSGVFSCVLCHQKQTHDLGRFGTSDGDRLVHGGSNVVFRECGGVKHVFSYRRSLQIDLIGTLRRFHAEPLRCHRDRRRTRRNRSRLGGGWCPRARGPGGVRHDGSVTYRHHVLQPGDRRTW